jgi:hypothetical protein
MSKRRKNIDSEKQYLERFDPYRDEDGWVSEDPIDYAKRMQSNLLPLWPKELLIEWLHRHNLCARRYVFLGFENLQFEKVRWQLSQIPGREAFYDPNFYDSFVDIEYRARRSEDWLANFMLNKGTWNTPIVLLQNPDDLISFPNGDRFRKPFHLLEGHRRLSFLNGLKRLEKALPEHDVWLASWTKHNLI